MVSIGLQDDGQILAVFGGVVSMAGFIAIPLLLRGRRRRKRTLAPAAVLVQQRGQAPVA